MKKNWSKERIRQIFWSVFLDHIDRIAGSLNDHAVFVDAVCLHEAVFGCHEIAD